MKMCEDIRTTTTSGRSELYSRDGYRKGLTYSPRIKQHVPYKKSGKEVRTYAVMEENRTGEWINIGEITDYLMRNQSLRNALRFRGLGKG
jgi:hypothetical protein